MFRAILCSSSGGQNCISTASGKVTLYERPCTAPVESGHVEVLNVIHILQNKEIVHQVVIKTSLYYDARSEKYQKSFCVFWCICTCSVDRNSSVGLAIGYGLDGSEIESRWRRDIPCRPERPWGPPNILCKGYLLFRGVKRPEAWR
jgi:hypothetical protein